MHAWIEMHKKGFLFKLLMPVISVSVFFVMAESILWIVGYTPTFNRNGADVPFWVQNAGTFERAIDQLTSKVNGLNDDVQAYQENYRLFYKLRPDMNVTVDFYDLSEMALNGKFAGWHIVTNSDGRRCGSTAPRAAVEPKKGSTIEVAFMGGSSIFGWGTDYDKSCVGIFQSAVESMNPAGRIHCTNYAVPGYALSQQLQLLKGMIKDGNIPRVIILDATSNCDVPSSRTGESREKSRFSLMGRLRFLMGKLRLFALMESVFTRMSPIREGNFHEPAIHRVPIDTYDRLLSNSSN